MREKKEKNAIKKYIVLVVICLLAFISFWIVFNEFQTKPATEPTFGLVASRRELMLKILLAISPFLAALTIAGVYIFWKRTKPTVLIKTVSKPPSGVRGAYKSLKMLKGDDRLVISAIAQSRGKILQKELTTMTNLPGYKITRILNRLERLGLVVRKKYGMTNIVSLNFNLKEIPEL